MSGVEVAFLAGLGFFAGIFGTLIGIGGGVLFVPVFLLVFDFTPQQAIGTSLVAVFFNAFSGSLSYWRQGRVDFRVGWKFALATWPGALLGAWLARYFTSLILALVFGLLMIGVAMFIFFRPEPEQGEKGKREGNRLLIDSQGEVFRYSPKESTGIAISFLVGVISSLLGIGGGIIHVPVLIFLLGFPVHIATATSHFILAISTLFGSGAHLLLGDILFIPAIIAAAFAILGAQIGRSE